MKKLFLVGAIFISGYSLSAFTAGNLELGKFSVSVSVADIQKSIDFYQRLGFTMQKGDAKKWALMVNGSTNIALIHGKFEGIGFTYNTTDVRGVQKELKARGISFEQEADQNTTGPAWASLKDPDGNMIMFDQYN